MTVINFTVTMKGLEDQLLVDVIKNERPDLEARKDKLVVSIANDQKQLLDIEEQILSMWPTPAAIYWTTRSSSTRWP